MDSNKKKNSVRYKCQVRDINKKSVSNTRFNADICFVTKVAWAVAADAVPFLMQLSRQLCLAIRVGKDTNAG